MSTKRWQPGQTKFKSVWNSLKYGVFFLLIGGWYYLSSWKNRQIIDRLLMTMLAKYNSKINSPDIWLTALVLVISLTLANMNLENIEEASVDWIIQWFHLAGTYIVGLFRNVLTTRSCCIETGEIPMHQQKVLAHCHNLRVFSNSFDRHTQKDLGALFASLTLRREIVATRRAGVTTSVIKRIPHKGKQCACICIQRMTVTLNFKN